MEPELILHLSAWTELAAAVQTDRCLQRETAGSEYEDVKSVCSCYQPCWKHFATWRSECYSSVEKVPIKFGTPSGSGLRGKAGLCF